MFGASNPFGQSSGSPFGSQTPFGQTSIAANNPFAPKPFGTTTSFGSPQTGSSIFGGTATGMFRAPQNSSAFPSTSAFGASSSPAFGASSARSFASSSAPFGGSSVLGQKPTFGGFGSTSQVNPFGSTSQPWQPAFGTSVFGSTTSFGAWSQPAFGSSSTPSFGSTSTPTFGSTSLPAFGSTSTPAFGSTSTPSFGTSSTPAFGSANAAAFGATSASPFGSSASPAFSSTGLAFGVSSAPMFGSGGAFGSSGTSAFGAPSTPAFSLGSSTAFGQSASAFGSSPFPSTSSSFGAQKSSLGGQPTTQTFGSTGFGQQSFGVQRGGSRVTAYAATSETETVGGQPVKLDSISAMLAYKDKSHEELRWEDYQLGDKGGQPSASPSLGGIGFGAPTVQPNPFSSCTNTQTSAGLFSSNTPINLFGSKTSAFGPSTTPAFSASTFSSSPNLFQSTSTSTSLFGVPTSSQPIFRSSASSGFGSTPSLFASTGLGTGSSFASGLNFSNNQTSPFQTGTFVTGGSSFSTSSPIGPTFGQSNPFGNPTSIGFTAPNLFSSTSSNMSSTNFGMLGQTNPAQSMLFQSPQPSQTSTVSNISNISQTQAGGSSLFSGTSNNFSHNNFGQWPTTSNTVAGQLVPITNPFGTLPTMPQISIGQAGTTTSVQYGISSMLIVDKPAPDRISSWLISRHLSQRRIRLPARKYHPKHDGPKFPLFSEEEETPSTPKADALFIPRENPRALVIRPMNQWPSRATVEKASLLKDASTSSPVLENEHTVDDGLLKDEVYHVKLSQKPNGFHDNHLVQNEESYLTFSGNRTGEAAVLSEHGAHTEAWLPKLCSSDYYTEPCVQELAAKERAEPGFCRHVRDFVVGRNGYGSIKFLWETDVRGLDLESIVQLNNREVIVYMDDRKKPPVGQGLNKPAEVTLLNIKCFDRKSGRQFTEGPKIEKYKEMLKRKGEDQGAEFVSYNPIKGEWKFRVNHFSMYRLADEDASGGSS